VLTIITFSLLITMTCGGWLWAVYSSFSTPESSCTAPRCLTNCYSKLHCCFKSYPYYPFCCNKDTCRRNSGVSRQVSPQWAIQHLPPLYSLFSTNIIPDLIFYSFGVGVRVWQATMTSFDLAYKHLFKCLKLAFN
jgi:hypothetical protein